MVYYIHDNYLSDRDKFSACESYWAQLFDNLCAEIDAGEDWTSYGQSELIFGNGTRLHPVDNPNAGLGPILRKIAPKQNRGVHVWQYPASLMDPDEKNQLNSQGGVTTKVTSMPMDTGLTSSDVEFLELRILLTEDSEIFVKGLLRSWLSSPWRCCHDERN